jgi:cytochrome P450
MAPPAQTVRALLGPGGRRNPYPLYEQLRAHGNLVRVRDDLMFAVGYAECSRALREPDLTVQDAASFDHAYPGWREHSSLRGYTDSMLYRNAPDHERMRRLVSAAFTPRRVEQLRPGVVQMTGRLLDHLAERGSGGSPLDFITEFASRLPIAVISALLGVPEADQAWFRTVAADISKALEGITSAAGLGAADAAMDELAAYFARQVQARRGCPADDVLGYLIRANATEHGALTDAELTGNLMLMLTAGFETTSFLLGHSLRLAFDHPRHAARLREDPDFATGYVEEVLRFEPPVQATSRWAARDLDIAGTPVAAGSKVVTVLAAGNRDPRRYRDPATFNPHRTNIQPLSFGAGGHFCLGAPLSRMEAQIAMPRLLRRFPDIAPAGEPVRRDIWIGRGFDHLPVTLR